MMELVSTDKITNANNLLVFPLAGNLYYALTHSPEPMEGEYLHALSWEAATKRLEAAGSVPVKEAELMKEALSSEDAGIEVRFRFWTMLSEQRRGGANVVRLIVDHASSVDRRHRRSRDCCLGTAKIQS
jgi:hypothetical protein